LVFVRGWGDDDFSGLGLGGMGYSHRSYKKIISNLLEIDFKLEFLKINISHVVMFQNVLMDSKILEEKQIFFFSQCLLEFFGRFKPKFEYLCLSNFIHMFTCNFIQM
jgi:hypothetical protein